MAAKSLSAFAVLAALALASCNQTKLVNSPPPGFRQDVFNQEAASKIDVLWVIDNSGSMAAYQQELSVSLSRFMELFTRGQVDYRIAVTTTDVTHDQGAFIGNPAIIDSSLADPVAAFQRNVMVGTGGSGHEEAFEAARLAIAREKQATDDTLAKADACKAACPKSSQTCLDNCAAKNQPDFMRPDAHLYLVFISNEEEQSFGEIRYFQRIFEEALGVGNEGAVSVSTICGDVPSVPGGCGATPGVRYKSLADATGGIFGSICEATFDKQLERLALDAVGLKRKFRLGRKPDPGTLSLELRYRCDTQPSQMGRCDQQTRDCQGQTADHLGISCVPPQGEPNGWTYEISDNSLIFHGDSVPGLRSQLIVSYQEP